MGSGWWMIVPLPIHERIDSSSAYIAQFESGQHDAFRNRGVPNLKRPTQLIGRRVEAVFLALSTLVIARTRFVPLEIVLAAAIAIPTPRLLTRNAVGQGDHIASIWPDLWSQVSSGRSTVALTVARPSITFGSGLRTSAAMSSAGMMITVC